MTEAERIERAARAIYEGRNGKGCKPWSLQTKAHKEPYLHDAKAALAAGIGGGVVVPREPTEELYKAVCANGFVGDRSCFDSDYAIILSTHLSSSWTPSFKEGDRVRLPAEMEG